MDNLYYDYEEEFWEWFDSLDRASKEKFWYYKSDAAFVYFFNAVFSKRRTVIRDD